LRKSDIVFEFSKSIGNASVGKKKIENADQCSVVIGFKFQFLINALCKFMSFRLISRLICQYRLDINTTG